MPDPQVPIIVISLKASVDRRKSISHQCEILGLEFAFFDAIDGRNGLPNEYKKNLNYEKIKARHCPLKDEELACAMSHALACKMVANGDFPNGAIILEDDATLTTDFADLLKSKTLENSGEAMISMGHAGSHVKLYPAPLVFKRYRLCRPIKNPWGAVCYFVSKKGAAAIYEYSWPICGIADWGFDLSKIDAKIMTPRIVGHSGSAYFSSLIGNRAGPRRLSKLQMLYNWQHLKFKFQKVLAIKVS